MKKIHFFLMIILWMILIFAFSAMSSNESNSKSKETIKQSIEKTLKITNKSGLTDKHPNQKKVSRVVEKLNYPLRKSMHASEYAILAILIFLCLHTFKLAKYKSTIMAIICSFLYACIDEYHQLFVSGRSSQFSDVLIDTLGAIIGIIIINIVVSIKEKLKRKASKQ